MGVAIKLVMCLLEASRFIEHLHSTYGQWSYDGFLTWVKGFTHDEHVPYNHLPYLIALAHGCTVCVLLRLRDHEHTYTLGHALGYAWGLDMAHMTLATPSAFGCCETCLDSLVVLGRTKNLGLL